ncbi:MAG: flagellar assembly protein FliW [Desulfobacterales bacterium]
MKIHTKFFGEIDIEVDKIIEFHRSLSGFEGCTRFYLLPEDAEVPVFYFMQCVTNPEIAFTVGFAQQFGINYDDTLLTPDDARELGVQRVAQALVILHFSKNPKEPSPSSLAPKFIPHITAPMVINPVTRRGIQKELKNICWSATVTAVPDKLPQPEADANCQRFLAMLAAGLKVDQA